MIEVQRPARGGRIRSPLTIEGRARGTWYFEADFPIRLVDGAGRTLGEHYASAMGEWMTEDFVPFRSELTFEAPTTYEGYLILERANPSGLPEHADSLWIPVRFR